MNKVISSFFTLLQPEMLTNDARSSWCDMLDVGSMLDGRDIQYTHNLIYDNTLSQQLKTGARTSS